MIKRGISLRKLNIIMLISAALISIGLFLAMNRTSSIYAETHTITQNLIEWQRSSYDLQTASDYLTEQMRNFVATGDRVYLDNYFYEAKVAKRRDKALELLEKTHSKTTAFRDLNAAMQESLSLMEKEYYAARLTILAYGYDVTEYPEEIQNVKLIKPDTELTPKQMKEMAIMLMIGDEYNSRKDVISSHMNSCIKDLDEEMHNEQLKNTDTLDKQVFIEHLLTILLIAVLLIIVILTSRLIIIPLNHSVELIREEQDIPIKGAYEIRFLAKTYNLMHHTNLQNKEKLTYEATHDKLTGLYNRRGYDFLMNNIDLETSALLLFDLDKFKSINDTYGHDVGDRILVKTADAIFGSFRAQDYICRIGGDEMAVIMVHSDSSLAPLLEKKIAKINTILSNKTDDDPTISISVGVAFGEKGITAETLFKRADTSLYKVKGHGKKGIYFYKPERKKKSGKSANN
ncbi:MAG: GGDEF domain-containing protein [Lachnospiraceae bacterium]|nr:GGDEF domain-containing protein [Lachnospiraceae bacterium]